ncbi:MAG: hypothetical protein PVF23_00385 [Chromatiales bacterium]
MDRFAVIPDGIQQVLISFPGIRNLERSGFTGWPLDDDIVRSLGDINRNEHWLGVMIACVSHLHLLKNHRYGYQ